MLKSVQTYLTEDSSTAWTCLWSNRISLSFLIGSEDSEDVEDDSGEENVDGVEGEVLV